MCGLNSGLLVYLPWLGLPLCWSRDRTQCWRGDQTTDQTSVRSLWMPCLGWWCCWWWPENWNIVHYWLHFILYRKTINFKLLIAEHLFLKYLFWLYWPFFAKTIDFTVTHVLTEITIHWNISKLIIGSRQQWHNDTQTNIHTDTCTNRHMDLQTHGLTDTPTYRQTHVQTHTWTYRQNHWRTNIQTDPQTDWLTDKWT